MKTTYRYETALKAALELENILQGTFVKLQIAGSLRRRAAEVHDIDLVVWPVRNEQQAVNLFGEVAAVPAGPDLLVQALRRQMIDLPIPAVDARVLRFTFSRIPVEIYLAEPGGTNFCALLQMRTGSTQFNARLAARAKTMRLHYRAGYGIFRGEGADAERVDDGTEAGIFAALGLQYMKPEERTGSALLPLAIAQRRQA